MAAKVLLRYVLLFIITVALMVFIRRVTFDYDSHLRLKRWQSQLKDRLLPMITEVKYVNMSAEARFPEAGLVEYARARISQPRDSKDIFELGMRLRAVRGYLEHGEYRDGAAVGGVYKMLEQEHFGWALKHHKSLFGLKKTFKPGRCIVIPTGKQYFRFAVHIIRSVRQVFNSSIPILVYYLGKGDLEDEHVQHLWQAHQVEAIDISQVFDTSLLRLKGWDIKPFAMLAAPFEEVMLMDADSVLMQPPDVLFSDPGYVQTGTLFFHDRTLFPTDHYKKDWVAGLFPRPLSARLTSSRYYQMLSSYEQEAGVVLVNKRLHFPALLSVCRLNCPPERDTVIHVETHGDKETFWMGFELVGSDYHFNPHMPGSLGRIQPDYENGQAAICGKLAHFDRNGTLLWFNDSIAENKKDEEWAQAVPEFSHYAVEGKWTPYLCLHGLQHQLTKQQISVIKQLTSVYVADPLATKKDSKQH